MASLSFSSRISDNTGPSNNIGISSGGSATSAKRRKLDAPVGAGILPCLVCKEQFRRRNDLWQHWTATEKGTNLFVCLKCRRGFCRDRLFREHSCGGGGDASNNFERTGLSVFCHVIACEECGLFVAMVNVENPSWKSYSTFCQHPSRSFRKITLYTWTTETIRFIRNDLSVPLTLRVDFGPSIDDHIPTACDICGEKYRSVEDIETHTSQNHNGGGILPPMVEQCEQCNSKFSSSIRLRLHVNEKHGGAKRQLMDFLSAAVVLEEPFVEQNVIVRNGAYVPCDLCGSDILGTEFNKHDCAVNYTRRYLLNGKVIFCPSAVLQDFSIDMGIQEPILLSLGSKTQRHVELCLRFYVPINAPKLEDFMEEPIYSCRHCEFIFVNQSLFREHVTEVLESQAAKYDWPMTRFEWPLVTDHYHRTLTHFGLPVALSDTGLVCPKPGCNTTWCSPVGLELHTKLNHGDTFQTLTIPSWAVSRIVTTNNNNNTAARTDNAAATTAVTAPQQQVYNDDDTTYECFICGVTDFTPQLDLKTHFRECHIFPCYGCGQCFISEQFLNDHVATSCRHDPVISTSSCYCPLCHDVFLILSDYYLHLLWLHEDQAKHDEIGELSPRCGILRRAMNINTNDVNAMIDTTVGATFNSRVSPAAVNANNATTVTAPTLTPMPTSANTTTTTSTDDDDDDCVVIGTFEATTPATNNAVKMEMICDGENGDADVAVCDQDPQCSNSRRLAVHGCNYCSQKFFTLKAAEDHRKTHAHDAGETTKLILPIPKGKDVYVCRLCCLAYEWYPAYKKHMENHKRIIECDQCTAVGLNASHLNAHVEAHRTGALVYGCYSCLIAVRNESSLAVHLNRRHNVPLVWLCKWCGLGNSDWKKMTGHLCQDAAGNLRRQRIIPTTKPKLHFQPRKEFQDDDDQDAQMRIDGHIDGEVAECTHRSFLACKETSLACVQCGTIMAATSYLLSVAATGDKRDGRLKLMLMDEMFEKSLLGSHAFFNRTAAGAATGTAVLATYQPSGGGGGLKRLLPFPPMSNAASDHPYTGATNNANASSTVSSRSSSADAARGNDPNNYRLP